MTRPVVFLGCPSYGGIEPETVVSLMQASREMGVNYRIRKPDSLLAMSFNCLWCEALNSRSELGLTDFAMIHSDVDAWPGWLDILYEERIRVGADILSRVLPIKNEKGVTSTAIHSIKSGSFKRLTMKEVLNLPITFCRQDVTSDSNKVLVVNTGLWTCDFSKSWVEQVHFEIKDSIIRDSKGTFQPMNLPEDWHFSIQAHNLGCKVYATRCVEADHLGRFAYSGNKAWGSLEQDE